MSYRRPNIVNTLLRRINSFSEGYRQNIAIIGEVSTGKTSLIKTILSSDEIKKDTIVPIYLEVKIEPFEYCAKRFIKSALFHFLGSDIFLASPNDAEALIGGINERYPKTAQICRRVLQYIDKEKFDEAFLFMMDISASIFEESKKRCVVILDEFHNIGNFMLKHPFGALAKKIMIQKDTMYLIVSSQNTLSQRILNERLSMLFGNFEKIILPPFDVNMSRVFIQDNIVSLRLPQVYVDFIASFVGNKPLYMQIICEEMERSIISKKVSPEDYKRLIEIVLTQAVFRKTGIINQRFSNFFFGLSEGKMLSKSAAVLIALSDGNKKQSDIARAAKIQRRDVSMILNKLVEMDIIIRTGSFYRFRDKLFSFWLRYVYLRRILSFSINEIIEEDCFKKDIMDMLDDFIQEYKKQVPSRITDLFRLFRNDILQLNGKKHKFLSFNNIRNLSGDFYNNTRFLAISEDSRWLCTIRNEYVTENDIVDIISNVKRERQHQKINKHIFIPLKGMNENAYLMAKEAKFWIWDLESVNVLMELYGKPHII